MGPRLLLVRPDHLGDVLLTLPAALALRRTLADARITYLVAEGLEDAPRRCPAVDEVLPLPFPHPAAPPDPTGWREVVRAATPALRGRFDLALLLRPNDPWGGALTAAAGVPLRVGYDQPGTRPFLTRVVSEPARSHAADLGLHLASVAARGFGAGELHPPPSDDSVLVPTRADEAEAEDVLASLGRNEGDRPVLLHPGSGWRLKNWPARKWGQLARSLSEASGERPVVVGGRPEHALVEAVRTESGGRADAIAGRLSVGGLLALQRRARLVIATDSGALHLAVMAGAPVVGLYGPADPALTGPWRAVAPARLSRVDLPCSPCGRMEYPPCGAVVEPACVTGIGVESVAASALELMAAARI